jgi:hypothetical protein
VSWDSKGKEGVQSEKREFLNGKEEVSKKSDGAFKRRDGGRGQEGVQRERK